MRRDLISKVMSEMGRKGGKAAAAKGGKARMAALTPEQRKELARKQHEHDGQKPRKKANALPRRKLSEAIGLVPPTDGPTHSRITWVETSR